MCCLVMPDSDNLAEDARAGGICFQPWASSQPESVKSLYAAYHALSSSMSLFYSARNENSLQLIIMHAETDLIFSIIRP